MIKISTCVYNRLWIFLQISPVSQKVQGRGGEEEKERFPPKAWRLSSLLDTINSFVFSCQTQHFLPAKTDEHHFRFLVATHCKYRESIYNCTILSFVLFFRKDPFDEPFYKNKKVKLHLESHSISQNNVLPTVGQLLQKWSWPIIQLDQELFSTWMRCFCWAKRENSWNKTSRIKLKVDGYYDL